MKRLLLALAVLLSLGLSRTTVAQSIPNPIWVSTPGCPIEWPVTYETMSYYVTSQAPLTIYVQSWAWVTQFAQGYWGYNWLYGYVSPSARQPVYQYYTENGYTQLEWVGAYIYWGQPTSGWALGCMYDPYAPSGPPITADDNPTQDVDLADIHRTGPPPGYDGGAAFHIVKDPSKVPPEVKAHGHGATNAGPPPGGRPVRDLPANIVYDQ